MAPIPPPKDREWRSPEGHTLFHPPSSYLALQKAASLPISTGIFLDPSIIPTLPPPGARVSHQELMGRGRPLPRSLDSQRPAMVRRSSSTREGTGIGVARVQREKANGHSRTRSDQSNVDTLRPVPRSPQPPPITRQSLPSTAPEIGIRLGREGNKDIARYLTTLHALTPAERVSAVRSLPQSAILHPAALLSPFAIVLEVLVTEREVLRGTYTSTNRLPKLRDGSTFQLKDGDGELDWKVTRAYVRTLGEVCNDLLPLLQRNGDKRAIEELTKRIREYVGKLKKVFGEVAAMYVEGFGFVRGWWDESEMKGAAAEIGRWGDVFDA
ncbi:hypothetical protein P7C73_g5727, partial [Tremellales sp. Uapishka_1]